ncbi:reverse transcriptase domain-containing protein [Tanacetum coccineum]
MDTNQGTAVRLHRDCLCFEIEIVLFAFCYLRSLPGTDVRLHRDCLCFEIEIVLFAFCYLRGTPIPVFVWLLERLGTPTLVCVRSCPNLVLQLVGPLGSGYSNKDKNKAENRQNRARDWKSMRKAKPKAYSFLMGQPCMRTRSLSNLIVESSTIPKRHNRRRSKQIVKPELRTIVETPVATMADTRTMLELLQAPTEGYGDEIVIPAILAENFELKVGLLQLVTSSQFHGFERDDPHAHIRWFNKITSTLKYKNVPHGAIKLMLFPFSLEGAARIWLEKEPPRSILTWEDLVSKFVNYFFPPSKTTNLKNDIMNFQQKFDETFSEAWDRFKDLLRKCPHHGFSELHQIDTFYNALTQSDQDSLNAAAGGNLLNRTPRDALKIIKNKSKVRTSRNKPIVSKVSTTTSFSSPSPDVTALTEIVKELVLMNKANQQASVKAVEETCVTCGGPHPYYECLATDGNTFNAYAATGTTIKEQNPSGSGSLPSNIVANPRGDVKAITTRSGVAYDGPKIPPTPSPLLKEVERETEATKDKPEVAPKPKPKSSIPYPSRLNDQKLCEKANYQMLKFLQIFQRLHFDLSFRDALLHIPKFAYTFKSLLSNKEKLFELANTPLNENFLAVLLKKLSKKLGDPGRFLIPCDFPELVECLALADLGASINLMPLSVWKKISLPKMCMIDGKNFST